ncbi:rCG63468 [Rattus norvegicus]|uniref:RCG63468 n=1 Tax=Rattus norvegicus TaxID=10116 RepID=A6HBF2_RAT|nr:rCG63468 [Rattus norvegicus]
MVNVLLVNGDKQQVEVFLPHKHLKLLPSRLLFLLHFYPRYSSLLLSLFLPFSFPFSISTYLLLLVAFLYLLFTSFLLLSSLFFFLCL